MIDAEYCNGCIHWRTAGWKSNKVTMRNRVCHYILDTGRSRVKTGNTETCSCRSQKVGFEPVEERIPRHKFDLKPEDVVKIKKNHAGGRKLSFSAEHAKALIAEGKTDEEIANQLGIKIRTFKAWRLRHKIQGNRKRNWSWSKKRGEESAGRTDCSVPEPGDNAG